MSKTTTPVDLVIRVEVVGKPAEVKRHRDALSNLASVMAVQARFCTLTCGWRWACQRAPMPIEAEAVRLATKGTKPCAS